MPWTVPVSAPALRLLERSLASGSPAHAYLFVGPEGGGKLLLARQMAQALLCTGEEPPCLECRSCRRIEAGLHADVQTLSPGEMGSIGIDQIREIASTASLQPFEGRGRVVIVNGSEAMTREAANAFLKTLEEPPPNVTFLLLAEDEEALLETVRSRCQRIPLASLPFQAVADALEKRGFSTDVAERVAHLSQGRLEASIQLAEAPEQMEARRKRLVELAAATRMRPAARLAFASRLADAFYPNREDVYADLGRLASLWRDVMLTAGQAPEGIVNSDIPEVLKRMGEAVSLEEAADVLQAIQGTIEALRRNANPRLALEALLLALPKTP
ncbi:MAG: DNA polymerase III subunit delta' [Chloroflexi bacterium]|nr:DNA polymerase III subunit delta' [Chloroflexota bacterium]